MFSFINEIPYVFTGVFVLVTVFSYDYGHDTADTAEQFFHRLPYKDKCSYQKISSNLKVDTVRTLSNIFCNKIIMKSKTWKKNLYENHGLPDNYTDKSFLEQLRKNIKPNTVTVKEAITLSANISIQLSIVILFVIVFIWLNNEWTSPNVIFVVSTVLTIVGYIKYINKTAKVFERISKDLRTVLIFLAFGYILSPVLKTLTETISTDTIYAMTIFMFLVHLIFSKYGPANVSLSESLSITSSIFGSLMLTSRLSTPLHAFSLLTVAVQCFVLLPFLLCKLNNKIFLSINLTSCTLYLLWEISTTLSYVFIAISIFIHFICPLWYIKWQKYKENIYGPWDEAVVDS